MFGCNPVTLQIWRKERYGFKKALFVAPLITPVWCHEAHVDITAAVFAESSKNKIISWFYIKLSFKHDYLRKKKKLIPYI